MTDGEAEEVLHTAMTVGATRMQVMLAQETAKLGPAEGAHAPEPAVAAGKPAPRSSPQGEGAPAFAAAEVVEQAGAG